MTIEVWKVILGFLGTLVSGGALGAFVQYKLDEKKSMRADRRTAVWTWWEGLARFEREALDARRTGMPPPDPQREAWYSSFALHVEATTLARIDELVLRDSATNVHYLPEQDVPREQVAFDIQSTIAGIARTSNIN